ncbi:TRAP transporter small permease subunit [Roseovarius autotrophicus]|uniref:TRAP transporter small permease subunit n=1 Tax=Roseovarius autotrophicus TaxID=2824121 RepID=UPI0019E86433|nr:TRAP transporter small permease subunit [Roseovarius autotrophicus]MBE0452745.1 TRAP transporter small permease subunit [Roseovarius sp.]
MTGAVARAEALLAALRRINRVVALGVGALLLGCAALVLADVVLRRLAHSFGGTDEISGYVMAIATAWGMGYALMELGHVRIDFLRARGGAAVRAAFDLFALLTLAGTVSVIGWRAWPVVERSLANGSRANTPLETPLALVQMPWFAGWVWFALMAWLTFLAALVLVLNREFGAADRAIGALGEAEAQK